MNAVIDIGNTSIKVGLFEGQKFKEKFVTQTERDLPALLGRFAIQHVIISSVATYEATEAVKVSGTVVRMHAGLPVPLAIRYETPLTLGVDRVAAACGAWTLFPRHNCLVIDAGTCINYEVVTSGGEYLGGAISPGVRMRFKAMHEFTARLPLAEPAVNADLTGKSTLTCLQSGVMNGIKEEINGTISRYKVDYPDLKVILCGGDLHFFEKHVNPSIFVTPELVLLGLNSILLYNVTS